jgi:hypothetical protein
MCSLVVVVVIVVKAVVWKLKSWTGDVAAQLPISLNILRYCKDIHAYQDRTGRTDMS